MVLFRNTLMLVTLASTLTAAANPIVYLIRHGEKKGDVLSKKGQQRAQCIVDVFDTSSTFDIGYIIAEQPESGKNPPRGKNVGFASMQILTPPPLKRWERATPLRHCRTSC